MDSEQILMDIKIETRVWIRMGINTLPIRNTDCPIWHLWTPIDYDMLQDLVHIEIKELNKKIKEKGVSKELAVRLKQRRRTLKNRNYATRYP